MKRGLCLPVLAAACLCASAVRAVPPAIYAAPGGNDAWSGSLAYPNASKSDGPVATLPRALELSRAVRRQNPDSAARVVLRGGAYALEQPLVLTLADSGLIMAAYPGETPIITGEAVLAGWRRSSVNDNVWEAPASWRFHELFINGHRKTRARFPESGFFRCVGGFLKEHPDQLRFRPGEIKESWAREGAELVLLSAWAQSRNVIRAVDSAANLVTLAGTGFPNESEASARYYIENAPEALRPGQWCQDKQTGLVTYWPEAGEEDLSGAIVTAPRLCELARLEGEKDKPIHHVVFDGLVLAGTDWRLDGGHDTDTQAAVEVGAAVQARFAEHCAIERCRFTRLGGYAVDLGHSCQHDEVTGCEMWDLGAGGVRLGDSSIASAGEAANLANEVTGNHIHNIGLVQAPAVGVLAMLTAGSRIDHNEIDHTFYTGISVGWSWGYAPNPCRSNIVEYNLIHDIGQGMLSDMGGVYTLGPQPGTIIRGNVIHDVSIFIYGGWGLYTDEGSSGIVLESNIVYRCQSAGFHQHYGATNLFYNNILALNRDHQLMRTRAEPHVSFTFSNNIVYYDSGDLFGGNWSGDGFVLNHNIYFEARAGASRQPEDDALLKRDPHPLFADPMFESPQTGDFRLKRKSPAIAFGFHPLDARQAGPR
ncbi:MAG TPA: right-handed parallel beta-helix repeat-containing protein [Verrucomicrobiae bacterium]|jgi:hypothetical protein